MKKAKKHKDKRAKVKASGSPREHKAMGGYPPRQHQDVIPSTGQGPMGNVATNVPYGAAKTHKPAVGHGKGFRGW